MRVVTKEHLLVLHKARGMSSKVKIGIIWFLITKRSVSKTENKF